MPAIITKVPGRRKDLLPKWDWPLPPVDQDGGGEPLTLRTLISRIVRAEVAAFRTRQKAARYLVVMTEEEVRAASAKGRIAPGASDVGLQEVDDEQAVGAALQAFEDGMYLVLIDDQEQRDLEQQVFVTDDSTITFIRLTFLAG